MHTCYVWLRDEPYCVVLTDGVHADGLARHRPKQTTDSRLHCKRLHQPQHSVWFSEAENMVREAIHGTLRPQTTRAPSRHPARSPVPRLAAEGSGTPINECYCDTGRAPRSQWRRSRTAKRAKPSTAERFIPQPPHGLRHHTARTSRAQTARRFVRAHSARGDPDPDPVAKEAILRGVMEFQARRPGVIPRKRPGAAIGSESKTTHDFFMEVLRTGKYLRRRIVKRSIPRGVLRCPIQIAKDLQFPTVKKSRSQTANELRTQDIKYLRTDTTNGPRPQAFIYSRPPIPERSSYPGSQVSSCPRSDRPGYPGPQNSNNLKLQNLSYPRSQTSRYPRPQTAGYPRLKKSNNQSPLATKCSQPQKARGPTRPARQSSDSYPVKPSRVQSSLMSNTDSTGYPETDSSAEPYPPNSKQPSPVRRRHLMGAPTESLFDSDSCDNGQSTVYRPMHDDNDSDLYRFFGLTPSVSFSDSGTSAQCDNDDSGSELSRCYSLPHFSLQRAQSDSAFWVQVRADLVQGRGSGADLFSSDSQLKCWPYNGRPGSPDVWFTDSNDVAPVRLMSPPNNWGSDEEDRNANRSSEVSPHKSPASSRSPPESADGHDADANPNKSTANSRSSPKSADGHDADANPNKSTANSCSSPKSADGHDADANPNKSTANSRSSPESADGHDAGSDPHKSTANSRSPFESTDGHDAGSDPNKSTANSRSSTESADGHGVGVDHHVSSSTVLCWPLADDPSTRESRRAAGGNFSPPHATAEPATPVSSGTPTSSSRRRGMSAGKLLARRQSAGSDRKGGAARTPRIRSASRVQSSEGSSLTEPPSVTRLRSSGTRLRSVSRVQSSEGSSLTEPPSGCRLRSSGTRLRSSGTRFRSVSRGQSSEGSSLTEPPSGTRVRSSGTRVRSSGTRLRSTSSGQSSEGSSHTEPPSGTRLRSSGTRLRSTSSGQSLEGSSRTEPPSGTASPSAQSRCRPRRRVAGPARPGTPSDLSSSTGSVSVPRKGVFLTGLVPQPPRHRRPPPAALTPAAPRDKHPAKRPAPPLVPTGQASQSERQGPAERPPGARSLSMAAAACYRKTQLQAKRLVGIGRSKNIFF